VRGLARLGLVVVALAAPALGACSGPDELSLGSTPVPATTMVYVAPGGTPGAPGTRDRPLKTFEEALARLRPGSTLTVLDGVYDASNGALTAKCDDVTFFSGTDDAHRIIVKTEDGHERGAWLQGDGVHPPVDLEGCRFWTIQGLHVTSRATTPAPTAAQAGSVVVLRADDRDIVLRRLLVREPNLNTHAQALTVGPGCSDVLVEENELYAFHESGVHATRAGRLTLRRNYLSASDRKDGASMSEDADRGDYGFLLEETHDVIAENNVVEGVHTGFAVVGRAPGVDAAAGEPVANNRLLANVVFRPSGVGVRVDSRCGGQNPCPVSRTVVDTEISDVVVIGGAAGISNAGAVNTRVRAVTIRDAANGVLNVREPLNIAVRSTWSVVNSLAVVQNTAFKVGTDEAQWLFDRCAAASSNPMALFVIANANPNGRVQDPLPVPELGPCTIASPLRGAGAGATNVGATVLDRTVDGVLTPGVPLWDPTTRAFTGCGAVIPGANDVAACQDVHARLDVAACF
jgi:hypothetical protein